jgi:hypothetical protein
LGPRVGLQSFYSVGGRSCRSILASGGRLGDGCRLAPLAALQLRIGASITHRDPTERAGASSSHQESV